MDYIKFQEIVNFAFKMLQSRAPKDTGNLRYNAIRLTYDAEGATIEVDQSIAPYMPYTNEPWVSPKWHGRQNPNQYWFDSAFESLLHTLEWYTGGTAYRSDAPSYVDIRGLATAYRVRPEDIYINSVYLTNTYGRINQWNSAFPK